MCVEATGHLEREIEVMLFTSDLDAVSAMDYQALSTTLTFAMQRPMCANLSVLADSVLETNETFQINITSFDPAVNITLAEAAVIISDSNRE